MPVDLAVIPVAGRGTRLLPLTKSQPKEMLPIGRKPVVQYVVEELARCGIRRLLFITGPGKTAIENHFDVDESLTEHLRNTGKETLLMELEYERKDMEYFYTRQRRQLGLGHAVLCARPMVGDQSFVVALGDSVLGLGAKSEVVSTMIERYRTSRAAAVIAFQTVPDAQVSNYGIAQPVGEPGEVFELSDLVEKPNIEDAPSNLAVSARYVFSPAIFDCLEATERGYGDEIQLTDAIRMLIRQGRKVIGVRLEEGETRFDVGNFENYYRAFIEFAMADKKCGPRLRGLLEEILARPVEEEG